MLRSLINHFLLLTLNKKYWEDSKDSIKDFHLLSFITVLSKKDNLSPQFSPVRCKRRHGWKSHRIRKVAPRIYLWARRRYPIIAPNCLPKQICLVSIICLNRRIFYLFFYFFKRGIILGFCIVILLITVAHSAPVSAWASKLMGLNKDTTVFILWLSFLMAYLAFLLTPPQEPSRSL